MKAHPCIGGPLDGEHACYQDFWKGGEPGMYEHLKAEYVQFNNAHRPTQWDMRKDPRAKVAWIHISLLPPSISPRAR